MLFRASLLHLPVLLACMLIHRIPNQQPHQQPSSQQLWARVRLSLWPSLLGTSDLSSSSLSPMALHEPAARDRALSHDSHTLPVPFPFLPVPVDSWQAAGSKSFSSSSPHAGARLEQHWHASGPSAADLHTDVHSSQSVCCQCRQLQQDAANHELCDKCRRQ